MAQGSPKILQTWSEETAAGSILHVRGEMDLSSAPFVRAELMRLVGRGGAVIVDCSQLQYLDMSGIHVLEDCHQEAEEQGQCLVLVGSVPLVHRILTIVGLNRRMPVVDTIGAAREFLGRGGNRPGRPTS
ncbi:MAG TPA: STAS domain-containing protein [bacterium]|nr:STAS domain-containing protein [bacterium]